MAPRKAKGGARPAPAAPQTVAQSVGLDQQAGPNAAAELPADAGRYPVLSPLRFDGQLYRPDDPEFSEVVMPRDQALALQPLGVLGDELA